MAARVPIMGVMLVAKQFNTYTRQLQQAQRVTHAASGAMVDAAHSAQLQVRELNNLRAASMLSAEAADISRQMIEKQGEAQLLARDYARENAAAIEEIRRTTDKTAKEGLRQALYNTKVEQRDKLDALRQEQVNLRNRLAIMRTRAAESRDVARQVSRDRREEAAATREATAATQQHAAAMSILGAAMLAAGVPMLALTMGMVQYAAETERYTTAANIAAQARGASIAAIEEERDELDSMYVTSQQANRLIQQMAISNVGFAKASEVAAMAQDLSVASTLKASQVYEILTQAITTATTVRLRELGVVVDRGRIMNWYAAQLGKEADELTEVEERLGVYNYLVRISEGMQGAFVAQLEKTSGQLVVFNFYLTKIRETLGTYLLPVVNQVLGALVSLLRTFEQLPEPVKQIIAYATALSGIVLTLGGAFLLLRPAIVAVGTALGAVFGAGTVAAGVAGKTGALGGILATVLALPLPIKVIIGSIFALGAAITTNFGGLRGLWDQTFGAFLDSVRIAFVDSLPWIIASVRLIAEAVVVPFRWVDQQIRKITGGLVKDDWGFEFDPERFFVGAASMMGGYAAGIVAGFNTYVLPAIIGIINAIASFLGGSLPTEGPLADIETSGIEIIQAWSHGMESVSLKKLRKLADRVAEDLQQALYLVQDTLFDIQTQELELDKALYPFEDALFLARAAADLVIIPLEQQTRELERQMEALEEVAAAERERAEAYLRALEKEAEAMREMIEADEERLEAIDHEIFMEEQRLKIMGLTTSARLMELKGQKRLTEDNIKNNQQVLDTTEDQISAEEERLEALVTVAEAQIAALQAQIDTINASIELEEERILLAQEALRMEEARQAQARLALLEETRFWEEEQRMAQHYMDIISRIPAETSKRAKEAAESIAKSLGPALDFGTKFEDMGEKIRDAFDVEEAMQKMRDAFMKELAPALAETSRILEEELKPAWEKLGETWAEAFSDGFILWLITKFPARLVAAFRSAFSETTRTFFREHGLELGTVLAGGLVTGLRLAVLGFSTTVLLTIGETIAAAIGKGIGRLFKPTEVLTHFTGGPEGEITTTVTSWIDRAVFTPMQEWIDSHQPDLSMWATTFASGWQGVIPALIGYALGRDIGTPLLRWIEEMEPKVKEGESPGGLMDWGQAFLDFPSLYVTPYLVDSLELIMDVMQPWITPNAEERIITDLITWGNAFLDWVEKDAVPYIAGKLDIFLATITTWMDDIGLPKMVEHGTELAKHLIDSAEAWIKEKEEQIKDIGKTFVTSLWDGIEEKWTWIRNKVREFIQRLIDAAKNKLGIVGDPVSLVFQNMGRTLAESLEEGFATSLTAAIPQRINTIMASPGGAVVNNTTYGGSTYNISANYARSQSQASIRDDIRMMMALA